METLLNKTAQQSFLWKECRDDDWFQCFAVQRPLTRQEARLGRRSVQKQVQAQVQMQAQTQVLRSLVMDKGAMVQEQRQQQAQQPLSTTLTIEDYQARMKATSSLCDDTSMWAKAFVDTDIFLVHHLTAEVLGVLSALRRMKCQRIFVLFTGYNESAEDLYMPSLLGLKDFGALVLHQDKTSSHWAVSDKYSQFESNPVDSDTIKEVASVLDFKKLRSFTDAMGIAVVNTFLAFSRKTQNKLVIIEDGGYISPKLHKACQNGWTINSFKADIGLKDEGENGKKLVSSLLAETLLGGVEHTRNGYDANVDCPQMAFPMGTIAVSYLKTIMESETVAASILTATQDILYALGFVLKKRTIMLFGSRGNLGRQLARHIVDIIDPNEQQQRLFGCDLKVGTDGKGRQKLPSWMPDDSIPSGLIKEYKKFESFSDNDRLSIDLILGVTGGPTPGHPLYEVEDLKEWLLRGLPDTLYLISGSTKQSEFANLIKWMDKTDAAGKLQLSDDVTAKVTVSPENDPLSGRFFASNYCFEFSLNGNECSKRVMLFGDGMPINFTFYGVTTEIIDEVLAQLVCVAACLVSTRKSENKLQNRMYAVDFDKEFTENIYGFHNSLVENYPLPKPGHLST